MATPPVEELELDQIQGLVVRGYSQLPSAKFLLLTISDAARARAYLRSIFHHIDTAKHRERKEHHAMQIAFTAPGLVAFGVDPDIVATFQREFTEGMVEPTRSVALGDQHANDPAHWSWGRPDQRCVHALLLIYARTSERLVALVEHELEALAAAGITVDLRDTELRDDNKEHFGWRDGLSLPVLAGIKAEHRSKVPAPSWTYPIPIGEFVLGYKNEYIAYTESPTVPFAADPRDCLPPTRDRSAKDLGKNGSYLVFREYTQDVHALWQYLADRSREDGGDRVERAVALGEKMVGRKLDGTPLETQGATHPITETTNDFRYSHDPVGLTCPVGAHIRRANPRDVLPSDHDPGESMGMTRKHQMIRRGRPFGPRLDRDLRPQALIDTPDDGARRGLYFIALVSHLSRQFEFVQRSWLTSANFGALTRDGDTIAAVRRPANDRNPNSDFTCPAEPVRRTYKNMPAFTRLRGGAYFFLPGLRALQFIAGGP